MKKKEKYQQSKGAILRELFYILQKAILVDNKGFESINVFYMSFSH